MSNPAPAPSWVWPLQCPGSQAAVTAHAISGDRLYVGAVTGASVTIGSVVVPGTGGVVACLSLADRRTIWAKRVGTNVSAIDICPDGAVLIGGTFAGPVDFGGGTVTPPGWPRVSFYMSSVSMLNADGSYRWAKYWGSAMQFGKVRDVKALPGGAVLAVGAIAGSVEINPGGDLVDASNLGDAYVARFRGADGGLVWINRWSGRGPCETRALLLTEPAGLYICGKVEGDVIWNASKLETSETVGMGDAFVALLQRGDGHVRWVQRFGSRGDDVAAALAGYGTATELSPPIVVAGRIAAPMTLDGWSLVPQGSWDGWFALMGRSAATVARTIGTTGTDEMAACAVSGRRVFVAGTVGGPAWNAFVGAYDGAEEAWVGRWGGQSQALSMVAHPAGGVVVGGLATGPVTIGGVVIPGPGQVGFVMALPYGP